MKKVLALILAVLMFASLATTAFADEYVSATSILSDKLKEEVAAFNVAAKQAVQQVNDVAKANQADYDAGIKAWKAGLQEIAGVKTFNETVRLDIAGMDVVASAFTSALLTQAGVLDAIKVYDNWLNDPISPNSLTQTALDIQHAFLKSNADAMAAFAAEQDALMKVANAEFNDLSAAMDIAIEGFQVG